MPRPDVAHKTSFIDDIQKKEKKKPGPCSYEPKDLSPKSKQQILSSVPDRKTIFDEMEHENKKKNIPAAGKYDKVAVEEDKSKLKGNINKAEKSNYIDGSMRSSLDAPGVGNYNSYHNEDKRAAKWMEEKGKPKKASRSVKLPSVGTYQPLPVSYQLFENELGTKKRYKSFLGKEERWK